MTNSTIAIALAAVLLAIVAIVIRLKASKGKRQKITV